MHAHTCLSFKSVWIKHVLKFKHALYQTDVCTQHEFLKNGQWVILKKRQFQEKKISQIAEKQKVTEYMKIFLYVLQLVSE